MVSRTLVFATAGIRMSMAAAFLLITALGALHAQETSAEIPVNASASRYGTGWSCDPGYRRYDRQCRAIEVPSNAYATKKAYGRGWECKRGYLLTDGACVRIEVPQNAYLDMNSGRRWRCKREYRVRGQECIAIEVPKHGYLSGNSYDLGWRCKRGYAVVGGDCIALQLPDNAHIDYSGNDWACDPPFRKQDGGCVLSEEY